MQRYGSITIIIILLFTLTACNNEAPAQDDSPFGAHGKLHNDKLLSDMGIGWTRLAGPHGLHPDMPTDSFERALEEAESNNLKVIVTITTGTTSGDTCTQRYPKDIEDYKAFLKRSVEEYKDRVRYYQIENEPAGNFWCDSPENYAKLLREAYITIKAYCPSCQVVLAGATSGRFGKGDDEFYDTAFRTLKSYPECAEHGCYDIFDLHLVSCDICLYQKDIGCETKDCSFSFMRAAYETAKALQDRYGYQKPIWSTEFGTFSLGQLKNTEISLIKSFVYAHHLGIEKLFWRVSEDCCKILEDNEPTGTYYAYRTLIQNIKDYSAIEKIADSQYRFTFRDRQPVYVLWCGSGSCSLPEDIKGTVRMTDRRGDETTIDAAQITLTEEPIFIEQEHI